MIIVGSGPAGMAAALYTGRAELKTLLVERSMPGGQAATTDEIENYPGFRITSGPDLSMKMHEQIMSFGTEWVSGDVTEVKLEGEDKIIKVNDQYYVGQTLIIATGAEYRHLGVPGEKELRGMGVSYCATCDGAFYRGKHVAVVGGGDTAVEEANFLTKFADKVTLIHRRPELRANKRAQSKALENPKIDYKFNAIVTAIQGQDAVKGVCIQDVDTGIEQSFACDGVFVMIGHAPISEIARPLGITDKDGYVITNSKMETIIPGVYGAGDVRQKSLRQVVTAVSDGAQAGVSASEYIQGH